MVLQVYKNKLSQNIIASKVINSHGHLGHFGSSVFLKNEFLKITFTVSAIQTGAFMQYAAILGCLSQSIFLRGRKE